MTTAPRLMLVDDDFNVLAAITRLLRSARSGTPRQYRIETFTNPEDALALAEGAAFDLVLSDFRMPQMDGVAFLTAFRAIQPQVPRLIMSGNADLDTLIKALNLAGVVRFINKPWHEIELYLAIENALAEGELIKENQRLADELRAQRSLISKQEAELRRLEAESPGITRVSWGDDGSVIFAD